MGRRPDPEVQRLRERAVKLERQGAKVREIARDVGRSRRTVAGWLSDARGPRKPIRGAAIEGLEEGRSFEAIAEELNTTVGYVSKIELSIRGHKKRKRRTAEEMVDEYLADPAAQKRARFTEYDSFNRALVLRCNTRLDKDPRGSKEIFSLTIEQLEGLLTIRKARHIKPGDVKAERRMRAALRGTKCNLIQARAICASRERVLERPSEGLLALERLLAACDDCDFCLAEVSRRLSLVLRDLNRYRDALERLDVAKSVYSEAGGSGHDPRRNGPASCALAETTICFETGDYAGAAAMARHAIGSLVAPGAEPLFSKFLVNLAIALFHSRDPAEMGKGKAMGGDLLRRFEMEPSLPRAKTFWFLGKISEVDGDAQGAKRRYRSALRDLEGLDVPEGVVAIGVDIERLAPSPGSFRAWIMGFLRRHPDTGELYLPHELRPMSSAFAEALRGAKEDVNVALTRLREQSGGNDFLPDLVLA